MMTAETAPAPSEIIARVEYRAAVTEAEMERQAGVCHVLANLGWTVADHHDDVLEQLSRTIAEDIDGDVLSWRAGRLKVSVMLAEAVRELRVVETVHEAALLTAWSAYSDALEGDS